MSDNGYYAQRASEERRRAMAASDLKVREIHLEMASKYDALAAQSAADAMASEVLRA
jgi:hypothetical protein